MFSGPRVDNKARYQSRHMPRTRGIDCTESRQIYTLKLKEKIYLFRFKTVIEIKQK